MLKKVITYKDYDGKEATTEAYFNLTKTECVDLNLQYEADGGLIGYLKKLMAEKVNGEIPKKPAIDFVRSMIEKSYGVRPKEDPSLFLKEDDNGRKFIQRFKQSAAYDAYVYGLLSGEYSLDEFSTSVLPEINEEQKAEATKMIKDEGFDNLIVIDSTTTK